MILNTFIMFDSSFNSKWDSQCYVLEFNGDQYLVTIFFISERNSVIFLHVLILNTLLSFTVSSIQSEIALQMKLGYILELNGDQYLVRIFFISKRNSVIFLHMLILNTLISFTVSSIQSEIALQIKLGYVLELNGDQYLVSIFFISERHSVIFIWFWTLL